MRIVHVEDIFYPEAGYQVNILAKYEVLEGNEVFIVTCPMSFWDEQRKEFWGSGDIVARDKKYEEESGARVIRFPVVKKYSSRIIYKHGFSKYIDELRPDILFIHAESSVVTMQFLLKLRKLNYPVILDSHSLEMASRNKLRKLFYRMYRLVFTPIIKRNNIYVIRTQDDDFILKSLKIPLALSPFISFGADLTKFKPDQIVKAEYRAKLGIKNEAFVVVVTGKLTEGKGGLLLAEAFKAVFPGDREIVLITVGTPTSDKYGEAVTTLLNESENTVIRIPTQKYYDLAGYYQCSDLAVFARECSLSFYDAQACGLPVIVEDNRVNTERVSHNNGMTFIGGNVADLRDKISTCASMNKDEYESISRSAIDFIGEHYSYENISKEYTKLMKLAIEKKQTLKKRT